MHPMYIQLHSKHTPYTFTTHVHLTHTVYEDQGREVKGHSPLLLMVRPRLLR